MNKFKRAFKFAAVITVLINVIGLIVAFLINEPKSVITDSKFMLPITISLIFIPSFLSVYFFREECLTNFKSAFKTILKSALLSFSLVYIIVFFSLSIFKTIDIPFFNVVSLFNGILASTFTIFSTLIYYLITRKPFKQEELNRIKFSFKISLIIWLIITVFYILILHVLESNIIDLKSLLNIAFMGFVVTIFVNQTINYINTNQASIIRKNLLLALTYIINVLGFPVLFIFLLKPYGVSIPTSKFFQSIVIVGPYYLLITLTIHVYYIYLTNKQQQEILKQIGVTASLKYQQLKAQLSPHFLFNNISVLTSLIEESPEKAIRFSERLSYVYRYFLEQEKQELVSLNDELKFADTYIALLTERFEKAITFRKRVETNNDFYILPLALQQVLENVFKHNEISVEKPIKIEMYLEEQYIVIKNNINPKFSVEKSNQIGLDNIKKRYAYFTDEKIIIHQDDQEYCMKLPLLKIEN